MKIYELLEDGRIVKGVNTTVDVGPNEIKIQAAKFGNTVDKDGRPPTMSKKVKGSSTNVLYNLGMVKESKEPRYTAKEWAIIEGGHTLEETTVEPKKPGMLYTALTEGYKLQLERDEDVLVLHIKDNDTGKRTEVRGKPGYETNGYDPSDPLHKLLDIVGKSANISELMNGEVVTINPKHPDAERALAATDRAYNEAFDTDVEWISDFDDGDIKVFATKIDDAYIELTYKKMTNGDVYIAFSRGGRTSVTGEGGQNKIFGAVINHIQRFVAEAKPKRVIFSAFKPNTGAFGSQDTTRSSLYRRMVQRFASQNGYAYDVEDTGNEDTFILTRQGVDENFSENKKEGDIISPPGNTVGLNVFEIPPEERAKLNGTTVYHQTRKLDKVLQSGGLRPRADVSGEREFALMTLKSGRDWRTPKGIFVSTRSGDWFGDEISFKIEPGDKIYRAYSSTGHLLITNPVSADRFLNSNSVEENFADGKVKGKSRPGRVKRAGASCNGSVTDLRKRAKNSSGERAKMYHWCANMKSGKKK